MSCSTEREWRALISRAAIAGRRRGARNEKSVAAAAWAAMFRRMKAPRFILLAAVFAVVLCGVFLVRCGPRPESSSANTAPAEMAGAGGRGSAGKTVPSSVPRGGEVLSPQEKQARVERIRRDYDDVRSRAAAEYAAAAGSFPGGLNAFLRQLALLEREKRADLAAVLSSDELDALELAESNAGQTVRRALAGTGATEAQVLAVFRLEREFQDRFALVFDLTPPALLERQRVRDEYDGRVIALLDPMDALAWLAARDGDQGLMNEWVRQRGLPPAAAFGLWKIKGDFVVRRLELKAAKSVPPTALVDLIRETEARLAAAAGAETVVKERDGIFRWLPRP